MPLTKPFMNRWLASSPIFQAVRDAIESKNETELLAIESQEKGRWKAFIEGWKKLELAAAQSAEALASSDEVLAALKIHNAIPLPLLSGAARDEARVARAAAWNDYEAASAKADAAQAAARAAHDAAYKEAWGYDAAAAGLIAAYIRIYAAAGHDVEGHDAELIFQVAAHERQTACPVLGIPGWLEPLEILAKD